MKVCSSNCRAEIHFHKLESLKLDRPTTDIPELYAAKISKISRAAA